MGISDLLEFNFKKYNHTKSEKYDSAKYFGLSVIDIYQRACEFKTKNTLKQVEEGGLPQLVSGLTGVMPVWAFVTFIHFLLLLIYSYLTPASQDTYALNQLRLLSHFSSASTTLSPEDQL